MNSYKVLTQHGDDDSFIVPVAITAGTPLIAAQQRFAEILRSSQDTANAVLVVGAGSAHVFPVVRHPTVSADPLTVSCP